jgi:hypothetical protein
MRILNTGACLAAAGLILAGSAALAQEAKSPHVPLEKTIGTPHANRPIPSLAVINAAGAKLEGGKLTLTGLSPNTIVFSDRPWRAAGHEMTKQFLMQWDEGKDSFEKDPPNATVSVLGANPGEVSDAVVVLKSPKLDGTTVTFDVSVLEGSLTAGGPVALFIDWFAARGAYGGGVAHFGGVGGTTIARGGDYWHAPVYHGAWYGRPAYPAGAFAAGAIGGAALGAAAASAAAAPYYAPPPPVVGCGVYPYPPCY